MAKLTPTDKINFGKNAGKTLAEIYQFQPSYIEWLIINIPNFFINIEMFYELPAPTPFQYKRNHFTLKSLPISEELNTEQVLDLICQTDMLNTRVSVDEIKSEYGNQLETIVNFRFNEDVIALNEKKYNDSQNYL